MASKPKDGSRDEQRTARAEKQLEFYNGSDWFKKRGVIERDERYKKGWVGGIHPHSPFFAVHPPCLVVITCINRPSGPLCRQRRKDNDLMEINLQDNSSWSEKERGLCPVCSALTKWNCGQMRSGLNRVQKQEKKTRQGGGELDERKKGGNKERNGREWFRRLERESRITTTFFVMNLASFRGWPKATTKTNFMHLADRQTD